MTLTLVWLALGAALGLLAAVAGLALARRGRGRWLAPPLLGAVTAALGGWLATPLLDRALATPAAAWVCVVALLALRPLTALLGKRAG